MMDRKKQAFFLATFIVASVAVGFLAASFGTDYWVLSHPRQAVDKDTAESASNVTGGNSDSKFRGRIHFGLFHGYKELDYGLGPRPNEIWVYCEYQKNLCGYGANSEEIKDIVMLYEQQSSKNVSIKAIDYALFNCGLWMSTIIFLAVAIALGLTSMGFAMFNVATKPIETITGPLGLYIWNTIASLVSLLALILYVVLFHMELKQNIISPVDQRLDTSQADYGQWTSNGHTDLNYSFYFVMIATILFASNIITLILSGTECRFARYKSHMSTKTLEGVMMY